MRTLALLRKTVAAAVVACVSGAAFGQQYSVVLINGANAGETTVAYSVNSFGAVAATVPGQSRAGLWSAGFMSILQPLSGDSLSAANGINDSLLVVGTSAGSFIGFPVKWTPATGLPIELPNLGPRAGGAADVNNQGDIVGEASESTPSGNQPRAVMWPAGGGVQNLGVLPGSTESHATGVNNLGAVCGDSSRGSVLTSRAFYRAPGNGSPLVDIGNLGSGWALAADINDFGEIVGWSRGPAGASVEPFRWRLATGTMTALGTLRGEAAYAKGTNNRGQVAGYDTRSGPGGGDRAFLVTPGQGMVDLNLQIGAGTGWVLQRAYGLNNAGHVAGVGVFNGQTRGFLLVPGPDYVVPGCFADLNRDEMVNVADLTILLGTIGQSVTPGAGADVTGDAVVNVNDLLVLLGALGGVCR